MRHSIRALVMTAAGVASAAGMPARADFLTYRFGFSGVISSVDDGVPYLGDTLHLLSSVGVGGPFSGSGTFTLDLQNGLGKTGSFNASGSSIAFDVPNRLPTTSYDPQLNSLSMFDNPPGVPAHQAIAPTLLDSDFLTGYSLRLFPTGASMSMDFLHRSNILRDPRMHVEVAITSYSIVPEPGAAALLSLGLVVTVAGYGRRLAGGPPTARPPGPGDCAGGRAGLH